MSFRIDPTTPLLVPARAPVDFDLALFDDAVMRNDGGTFARLLYRAEVAGDRRAILWATTRWLATTATDPIGRERARLVFGGALAQTSDAMTVAELDRVADELLVNIDLMRFATVDLGFRLPGALDHPFEKAQAAAQEAVAQLRAIAQGRPAKPWVLIRLLSRGGAFHLAEAIATALYLAGNGAYGEVALAAVYRNTAGDPSQAVRRCDDVLRRGLNPAALNCKAASLGDLGRFPEAFDVALTSIALRPNTYSGNTFRRAARNVGRRDLIDLSEKIVAADRTGDVPPGERVGLRRYLAEQAARIVAGAGYRARGLAELALAAVRLPDQRAESLRTLVDATVVTR